LNRAAGAIERGFAALEPLRSSIERGSAALNRAAGALNSHQTKRKQ